MPFLTVSTKDGCYLCLIFSSCLYQLKLFKSSITAIWMNQTRWSEVHKIPWVSSVASVWIQKWKGRVVSESPVPQMAGCKAIFEQLGQWEKLEVFLLYLLFKCRVAFLMRLVVCMFRLLILGWYYKPTCGCTNDEAKLLLYSYWSCKMPSDNNF